jgi:hypothetical protein
MRRLGNLFITLSAIISILFGFEYFSETSIVVLGAFPLYLSGHYMRHNANYKKFKISPRSKPFSDSILRNVIHTIIYIIFFIFIGYLLLSFSKTDFYLTHLQAITLKSIELIDEIISFWINLPIRLMKYGN